MESIILFLCIILPGALCWSGPDVRPVFSAGGISGLSINGAVGAATWLVGNTQGGLDDDFASWEVLIFIHLLAVVHIHGSTGHTYYPLDDIQHRSSSVTHAKLEFEFLASVQTAKTFLVNPMSLLVTAHAA